jgi:hypothetical protein
MQMHAQEPHVEFVLDFTRAGTPRSQTVAEALRLKKSVALAKCLIDR